MTPFRNFRYHPLIHTRLEFTVAATFRIDLQLTADLLHFRRVSPNGNTISSFSNDVPSFTGLTGRIRLDQVADFTGIRTGLQGASKCRYWADIDSIFDIISLNTGHLAWPDPLLTIRFSGRLDWFRSTPFSLFLYISANVENDIFTEILCWHE